MLTKIQRMFALSRQGAKDLIKGCIACILQNLSLMVPVSLLYILVSDLMGGEVPSEHLALYIPGCAACLALILLTTWFQYNATYFATYIESGVRRISLAEKLRRLPLSFFGKKDLADLTSTIMADCTFLEQSFSHFVPELIGSIISTTLVAVSLFVFDWRMALAALWVVPVSFAIVFLSFRVQDRLNQKQMAAKIACADGIQECLEAMRDLKSNNAEGAYLAGLEREIGRVCRRAARDVYAHALERGHLLPQDYAALFFHLEALRDLAAVEVGYIRARFFHNLIKVRVALARALFPLLAAHKEIVEVAAVEFFRILAHRLIAARLYVCQYFRNRARHGGVILHFADKYTFVPALVYVNLYHAAPLSPA